MHVNNVYNVSRWPDTESYGREATSRSLIQNIFHKTLPILVFLNSIESKFPNTKLSQGIDDPGNLEPLTIQKVQSLWKRVFSDTLL